MKAIPELISSKDIQKRTRELGEEITKDYNGKELTVVGVLKGSILFLADLIRHIKTPMMIDFIEVSSYGDSTTSSGVVKFIKDLSHSVEGQHVLFVEDIIDTGLTMNYLMRNISTRHSASVKLCSLLEKKENRCADIKIDYCGFSIPDKFVVGYGLDYRGRYRNLDYVGHVEKEPKI